MIPVHAWSLEVAPCLPGDLVVAERDRVQLAKADDAVVVSGGEGVYLDFFLYFEELRLAGLVDSAVCIHHGID